MKTNSSLRKATIERNRAISNMIDPHMPDWLDMDRKSSQWILAALGYKLEMTKTERSPYRDVVLARLMIGDKCIDSVEHEIRFIT